MHLEVQAVLFDNDGTLIDSTAAIMRCWERWEREQGLRRGTVDTNRVFGRTAGSIAAEVLPSERLPAAVRRYDEIEADDPACTLLPGTRRLIGALPRHRWAVVTSAARRVALARLARVGASAPVLVTADDVRRGKPAPDPYLRAAALLEVDPRRCVVFEDAPAGLRAAKAAGMTAIGLTTTHLPEQLADADALVPDLDAVDVLVLPGGAGLSLTLHAVPTATPVPQETVS
ncbi:HAD-IA family hydrolase [Streptomyces sp. NPDC035033]|uniref:HAD-IA family hydrolase n=1 Tax=Streptomyces sp. NPDC035033 TaxID=3155368 RepID=UPI0033FA9CAA